MLLNPNCSEVIARLPVETIKEAKKLLESIGLEVIRYDPYVDLYGASRSEKYNIIIDADNINSPDFQNNAKLSLVTADYEEGKGIYIDGHQHCQHQLYKTIQKIERKLPDVEFSGWDGGSSFREIYDEWLNLENKEVDDYQSDIRKEIGILLQEKHIQQTIKGVFDVIDITIPKKVTETEKYLSLTNAVIKSITKRKDQLIGKQKEEIIKYHDDWQKKDPSANTAPVKMPSDKEILDQIIVSHKFRIVSSLYILIKNKRLAEIFLKNDQKSLTVLGNIIKRYR